MSGMEERWIDYWAVVESAPGGHLVVADSSRTEEGARNKAFAMLALNCGVYAYSIHEAKLKVQAFLPDAPSPKLSGDPS